MSLARLGPWTADCISILLQDLQVICRLLDIEDLPEEDDPLRYLDPRAAVRISLIFTLKLYLLSNFKS